MNAHLWQCTLLVDNAFPDDVSSLYNDLSSMITVYSKEDMSAVNVIVLLQVFICSCTTVLCSGELGDQSMQCSL